MKLGLSAQDFAAGAVLGAACISGLWSAPAKADPYATYAVLQMSCGTWQTLDYPKVVEFAVLGEWTGLNIAALAAGTGGTGGADIPEPEQIAALRAACLQTPNDDVAGAAMRVWGMMNPPPPGH